MKKEHDNSLRPIELSERVGWKAPLFNVLGCNIAISALMVGGSLISGMTFKNLLFTSIIGNLILVFILCTQGYIGMKEGLSTYVIVESIFGKVSGKWIVSMMLGITSFGWFGIQAGVSGLSLQKIFPDINLTLAIIVLGLLMTVFAVFGFNVMAKFNYIAIPPLLILMIWGTSKVIMEGGLQSIYTYVPNGSMSIVEGLNLVVGLIIVGAIISPDQVRFTRNFKDILIIGVIGLALISVLQQSAAGILSMSAPSWDITEVLSNAGFPSIAFLILLLAAWSTNISNAYSGGLALKTVFPMFKREKLTLVAGLLGTIVAASGIIFKFQNFLSILSMTIASLVGVIWVDYYIINKRTLVPRLGTNYIALISWLLGFLTSYITTKKGIFIPPINGIIISALVYYVCYSAKMKGVKNV